jgi:hypothetical protein
MDISEIPQDRPLTNEEFAALEKQLLETVREFYDIVLNIAEDLEKEHPEMAEELLKPATNLLLNVEAAAAMD